MCEIFPYNELSSFIPSLIGHVVVDDALSIVNWHVTIQKRLIAPKYWVFKAHCAKKVWKKDVITTFNLQCIANIVIKIENARRKIKSLFVFIVHGKNHLLFLVRRLMIDVQKVKEGKSKSNHRKLLKSWAGKRNILIFEDLNWYYHDSCEQIGKLHIAFCCLRLK